MLESVGGMGPKPIKLNQEVVSMDVKEALPMPNPNDRPYQARGNHTVEFAKRSREYAELYDQWESLISDARRLREEAESKDRRATEVRKQLEKVSNGLGEHLALATRKIVVGG